MIINMEEKDLFCLSENGDLSRLKDRDVKSIRIPDGARYICKGTFMGCPNLQTVYVPKSVEHIAGAAFMDCKNLQSVVFLDNNKRVNKLVIDDRVFEGCTSLRTINLPERVELRRDVFKGCSSLNDTVIFSMHGKTLIHYLPDNQATEYRIPDEVTVIGKYAFKDCTSLQSVIIPEGLEQVEDFAFQGCTSLENVFIPRSVTTIGRMAFDGCVNLMAFDVDQENQRYLSYKGVLFDYSNYTVVRFPPNNPDETHIESIPNYVRHIDSGAFASCKYMKSITIPVSVVSIGDFAFQDCYSLQKVNFLGKIDSIRDLCFSGCTSLNSINLPDNITEIEGGAFWGCTSLQSIVLPKDLTLIGYSAFCECKALHSVLIPKKVACIEGDDLGYGFHGAFRDCSSLSAIHCAILNPNDIEIGEDAFNGVDMDECTLFVPINTLDEYRNHPIFRRFREIIEERI